MDVTRFALPRRRRHLYPESDEEQMQAFGRKPPVLLGFKSPCRGNTDPAKHSALLVQVRSQDTRQTKPLNRIREFLLTTTFH